MQRIATTIAALVVALALALGGAATAAAAPTDDGAARAAKPGKGKTNLRIAGRAQKKILKKKAVAVRVRSTRSRRMTLRLRTSTYDRPALRQLAKKRVRLPKSGKGTVKIRLDRRARKELASCEIRDLQVTAPHSKDTVPMRRNSNECKPGPLDLSRADRCDFIAEDEGSVCLLPFPSDYYAAPSPSTRTGKRIDLKTAGMPANGAGVHIDAADYNRNDGFSPGQTIVVKVPGLDTPEALNRTDPVRLNKLSEYDRKQAPIVVIDEQTGERWPIWTEIDSNAQDASRRALLIHPAVNFEAGHRYIVAMRELRDAAGRELEAPDGFRYFRDGIPSKEEPLREQRARYDSIFATLREAGIDRANLYLAWNFTVASDENIAERVLHMRDETLAELGDTNLTDLIPQGTVFDFDVTQVTNFSFAEDPNMARRVQGTFEVPCYLFPNCQPGGRMNFNGEGMPRRSGTYTANFNCMIPRSALGAPGPARPSLYGHGLLGSANEATADPQKTLGNTYNIVSCATNEIGLSSEDIPNTIGILGNLSRFPELADRLQQGLLNEILLGRLMINVEHGFATDSAFATDDSQAPGPGNPYVIDPSRLYYNGNSQGAIEGGALTAISPDFTRASLGVGGMNYSVLLERSVDFDTYEVPLKAAYKDPLEQALILSLIQMLWDRGESNGYAHRMTDDPLPNTPPHEVLMNVGFGDHQVSTFTTDVMARTIGASVHDPVVYPGRWPGVEVAWGIPRIASYPFRDSALVYWDSGPVRPFVPPYPVPAGEGQTPYPDPDPEPPRTPPENLGTPPPPIENLPPRVGLDPHELPRRTAEEQAMVSDFLQPDALSHIDDECGGPCFDFTFDGP